MVIKRIKPMSFAKMNAVVYGLIGLLVGGMFSLIAMAGGLAAGADSENGGLAATFGMIFGIGAIIIAPICYAILGFIGGLIGAVVYNFAAGMMGGIEIETQRLVDGDLQGRGARTAAQREHDGEGGDAQHEDQTRNPRQHGPHGRPFERLSHDKVVFGERLAIE